MPQTIDTDPRLATLVRELDATIVASGLQAQQVDGVELEIARDGGVTVWSGGLPLCEVRQLEVAAPIWVVARGGGGFPEVVLEDVECFIEHEIARHFTAEGWTVVETTGVDDGWFRLSVTRGHDDAEQLAISLRFLIEHFSVELDPTQVAVWVAERRMRGVNRARMEKR